MSGEILDMVASPVTVVTTKSGDKINGMTVAWCMQAAHNPASVAISITPGRFSYSLIKESKVFCLNILSDNQKDLGKHFGFSSGRNSDKFKNIKFNKSKSGLPVLAGIYAYLDCKLTHIFNAGDHDLLVGEVMEKFVDESKKPLIFKSSDYF